VALRHAERHLSLRTSYQAELEPALDHFEAETLARRAEAGDLRARLDRSEQIREAIMTGRWWRLRERLRRLR